MAEPAEPCHSARCGYWSNSRPLSAMLTMLHCWWLLWLQQTQTICGKNWKQGDVGPQRAPKQCGLCRSRHIAFTLRSSRWIWQRHALRLSGSQAARYAQVGFVRCAMVKRCLKLHYDGLCWIMHIMQMHIWYHMNYDNFAYVASCGIINPQGLIYPL